MTDSDAALLPVDADADAAADSAAFENFGYFVDQAYTNKFHPALDPRRMRANAALSGLAAADTSEPFTYADFGCGAGLTLVMLAQAMPHARFFGVDLMAEHVATGRELAAAFGLTNVTFIQGTFDRLGDGDLPPLDYAVAHGVLSWVSEDVRRHLGRAVRDRLRDHGLFQASYNHISGWGDLIAAARLLKQGVDLGASGKAVQELVVRLTKNAAADLNAPPPRRLAALAGDDFRYVAHEFLNMSWTCFTTAELAAEMAGDGLSYVGPWQSTFLGRPASERPEAIEDAIFWEDARALRERVSFRHAIFAKSDAAAPLPPLAGSLQMLEGWLSASPDKAATAHAGLAASGLGRSAPFGSVSLGELDLIFAEGAPRATLPGILMHLKMVHATAQTAPQPPMKATGGVFAWTDATRRQTQVFNALGLLAPAIAAPGVQAVIELPPRIARVLHFCEGAPLREVPSRLAELAGRSGPNERDKATAAEWRDQWAPWLAGHGVIDLPSS